MRNLCGAQLLSSLSLLALIHPSLQQSASDIPVCAQQCIANAIIAINCTPGDRKCECSNSIALENAAGSCILAACSTTDINTTIQVSQQICAAYSASASASLASKTTQAPVATSGAAYTFTVVAGGVTTTIITTQPAQSTAGSGSSGNTSSGSSSSSTSKKTGLGTGAIAGIAIAAVALIALIAILLFFCLRKKRRTAANYEPQETTYIPPSGPQEVDGKEATYVANGHPQKYQQYAALSPVKNPAYNVSPITQPSVVQQNSLSPQSQASYPYQHELSSQPDSRIINVAEADSYAVPYGHHAEADSRNIAEAGYENAQAHYSSYRPPPQEAGSSMLLEKDANSNLERLTSASTGVSAPSRVISEADPRKLEALEGRLERLREEKERLSRLQELEEREKELKAEVMEERRKAMGS